MIEALTCEGVSHSYGTEEQSETVLRDVSLRIAPAECAVLTGPSGSGKTTLLSIAGCLLTPRSGVLRVAGRTIRGGRGFDLSMVRRTDIGFVFQHAHLLPFLSVRENLEIVGKSASMDRIDLRRRISELLDRLEMEDHAEKRAGVLSGGQRQRVAVARALLHRPAIVLADEPTSALGWEIGQTVVELLTGHAREEGAGLLVVTHDMRLLPAFDSRYEIESGSIRKVE